MNEDQIKHMVDSFLMWKLPDDFTPDCGISFERMAMGFTGEFARAPVGTNLLTASQAREMVLHMLGRYLVVVPRDEPTEAMARAWTNAAPPGEPALLVRYSAMMKAAQPELPRAGMVCRCGVVMKNPSDYAAHCRDHPDHFVTLTGAPK